MSKIGAILENVLEQYAFCFCEPVAAKDAPPQDDLLQARMTFEGPCGGAIGITVPRALAVEVAANARGIDADEVSDEDARDALRELLNILCGQLLTAVAGEEPAFRLSIPAVTVGTGVLWNQLVSQVGTRWFVVEEWPVMVEVEMSGGGTARMKECDQS